MTPADSRFPAAAPKRTVAPTNFSRKVYCVFGLPFDAVTLRQAAEALRSDARAGRRCFLSTPNLNFLINSIRDTAFRDSVLRSDLSVADGMPIVWLARAMGAPIMERVAGSSIFEALGRYAGTLNVFFFGGPDGVAGQAAQKLNAAGGLGLHCVGFASPGFGSIEAMSQPQVIAEINASGADFLVVSLGAKKGQAWIEHNLPGLHPPVVSHLGAVVNFAAGTVSRAPAWVQKLALEWLWRIKEEPGLWRRYWQDGIDFLKLILGRFIPALALDRKMRNGNAPAGLKVEDRDETCTFELSGAWTDANLGPLRQALQHATEHACHLRFDLARVDYMDGASLALLMLAYGHQSKSGGGFSLHSASPRLQRLFHLQCAGYLFEPLKHDARGD